MSSKGKTSSNATWNLDSSTEAPGQLSRCFFSSVSVIHNSYNPAMTTSRRQPTMISPADLADAIAGEFEHIEGDLRIEHAVYGLDARNEVALHTTLADALQRAGFGVYAEQRYPGQRSRKRSEGERCDLVITADALPLRQPDQQDTLFDAPNAIDLDEAFWMEVKVVNQFTIEGPNGSYSSDLLSTVRKDVRKLSREPGILRAGLLIVLFVADPRIAEHDLHIWEQRCIAGSYPIEPPIRRDIAILDRHGNDTIALALYPVRHI